MRAIVSATIVLVSIIGLWVDRGSVLAEQATPSLPGQGIPRCNIPKDFGRLVTVLPGSQTGLIGQATSKSANGNILAAQAIFESPDGAIRWVAIVAPANTGGTEKPALRIMPRNFPVLPLYECAIAQVWQRP